MSLLKSFNYRKEAWAMQELFIKKEKKRVLKKNGQVSEISKIMGTQIPAIKKERDE